MNRFALYLVVTLSGACVLAIEILGTRLLGPWYGVSLFLWSALISVTLAALSAGYALGGAWADRGITGTKLAVPLAIAGVWMLAVPWLREPVIEVSQHWGLRAAVLATATVLFFPPLLLLGMVSPAAIRLRANSLEEVGRASGALFAISTLASVAGALLTGFWLVPILGVTRLTLGIGVALLVAALVARTSRPPRGAAALAALALIAALAAAGGWAMTQPPGKEQPGTRFVAESPYAEIRVLDRGDDDRLFLIDGGVHSFVRFSTFESKHTYVVVSDLARAMFAKPGRLLLVGLGGGSAARSWARDGWQVDAVEIDPLVPKVAREYFGLRPDYATIHVEDGRRYMEQTPGPWDAIFFDAYGSSQIPFHLISAECFALAKRRLAPGGMLVLNVESVGWEHPLIRAVASTLRKSFAHVIALPIAEPPDQLGNVVLIASDRDLSLPDYALGDPVAALADEYEHWRVVSQMHAWNNRFEPQPGVVLTDDLNPVDVMAEQVNYVARADLHRLLGQSADLPVPLQLGGGGFAH